MSDNETEIGKRLGELDRLLHQCEWLWRPQPFKQSRPDWCRQLPQLCDFLLALDETQLRQLSSDQSRLIKTLQPYIPQLGQLHQLSQLPACRATPLADLGPHFHSGIPGRKWQQIEQFAAALGEPEAALLEWCGGKGHLGRLLGAQWDKPVVTVEHDEKLCREGGQLAQRARVEQRFFRVDALSAEASGVVAGRHAVALHACGELHRTLLRQAVASGTDAFDIAPCCYYLGAGERYTPFNASLQLMLGRDDLRLAVTETVTAAEREVTKRDREMAWKLGYDALRRELCGVEAYRPMKPIKKEWLKLGFEGFCRRLAEREGHELPPAIDWPRFEQLGQQRQREVMRLNLLRAAFRRGLEMWLVLDMARYIEAHGYRVELATFCDRELTPRNILISARRSKGRQ